MIKLFYKGVWRDERGIHVRVSKMQNALRKNAQKRVKQFINSLLNYAKNALRKMRATSCQGNNVDQLLLTLLLTVF